MSSAHPAFVHLRLHTEFSLQDSVVRIPELVERAAALGMPAVAVTDQNNLFAMVKFYREALKRGVKPIIGVDVLLRARRTRRPTRLTLLCKDPGGYQNVTNLVTRAWLEGQERGVPLIERAWLDAETTAGLIALSGSPKATWAAPSPTAAKPTRWRSRANGRQLFGDRYYLELQRLGRADDESQIARSRAHRQETGIPVVATNDVRFLAAQRFRIARGARLHPRRRAARRSGRARDATPRRSTCARPTEMAELFADMPGGAGELGRDRAPLLAAAQARRVAPAGLSAARRHDRRGASSAPRASAASRSARKAFDRDAADAHRRISRAPRSASSASSARWVSRATS